MNPSSLAKRTIGVAAMSLSGAAVAAGDAPSGFPTPQTAVIYEIHNPRVIVLCVSIAIMVFVFGMIFFSILRYRWQTNCQGKRFHGNTSVEIMWSAIPCLIVAALVYPSIRTTINPTESRRPDIAIKVTGFQWNWRYAYPGEDIDAYSPSPSRDQIADRSSTVLDRLDGGADVDGGRIP